MLPMARELDLKTTMRFAYGEPAPVSPGIVRIVASNPSALTFKGTNTYLLGMTELAVIDPGPDDERHGEAIMRAARGRPITHIVVTHAHRDHVDGAARLKAATGTPIYGFGRAGAPPAASVKPQGSEYVDYRFEPDVPVGDGDTISGKEWRLAAIHTPGHAPDHLCFALKGRGVLFSGDHVMAWNTTLVAPPEGNMADYIASLERLMGRSESLYLPGHGGRLAEPLRTVKAYLLHRRWREQSIVSAIVAGARTIRGIVPSVYPGIDEKLATAATLSVAAHVEHLIGRGVVTCEAPLTWDRPLFPA
jgi:glyoxylase-like metal-dependent hydrolase (beta-lactamase superfamily II)